MYILGIFILDGMFIHREWTENGQLWIQQVSSTPATRMDVVNLQVVKIHIEKSLNNVTLV